jgi:hypothetical protein
MFRVCVCSPRYPACEKHAPYCRLWLAHIYNIFPHHLLNGTIFKIKKTLLNTKYEFLFYLQLMSETFLILRTTEQEMIKMYIGLRVIYTLLLSDS